MRTWSIVLLACCASLLACGSALAGEQQQSITAKVCAQVKGPANSWSLPASLATQLGIPRVLKGTSWTVIAAGVPCTTATAFAPSFLKQWRVHHAKVAKMTISGWTCAFNRVPSGSSSGGSCYRGTKEHSVSVVETGPYTLSQVRQLGQKLVGSLKQ